MGGFLIVCLLLAGAAAISPTAFPRDNDTFQGFTTGTSSESETSTSVTSGNEYQDFTTEIPVSSTTAYSLSNGFTTESLSEDSTTKKMSEDSTTNLLLEDFSTKLLLEDSTTKPLLENSTTNLLSEDSTTKLLLENSTTKLLSENSTTPDTSNCNTKLFFRGNCSALYSNLSLTSEFMVKLSSQVSLNLTADNSSQATRVHLECVSLNEVSISFSHNCNSLNESYLESRMTNWTTSLQNISLQYFYIGLEVAEDTENAAVTNMFNMTTVLTSTATPGSSGTGFVGLLSWNQMLESQRILVIVFGVLGVTLLVFCIIFVSHGLCQRRFVKSFSPEVPEVILSDGSSDYTLTKMPRPRVLYKNDGSIVYADTGNLTPVVPPALTPMGTPRLGQNVFREQQRLCRSRLELTPDIDDSIFDPDTSRIFSTNLILKDSAPGMQGIDNPVFEDEKPDHSQGAQEQDARQSPRQPEPDAQSNDSGMEGSSFCSNYKM